MKSIMDTSTPVKKKKSEIILNDIRRKALKNDLEQTSNVSPSSAAVDDAEFVYSQQPIDTRLNKSEELFPFSPIPFRKEVPSMLLPLLDTPDTKWTSSIFTSFYAQSENASPEELSEDNFIRTIHIDGHIENEARYTTGSSFNSQVPDFPNDAGVRNEHPSDSCVEISGRPSPPVVVSRRKEKKVSSVNKELLPFFVANDQPSREKSPPLDCGAMGDMTLNALEQICVDSEIMYSKNSSKKSNIGDTFEAESESIDLCDSNPRRKNKRSFIYPCASVKKPECPVLVTDILQTVLSLETNEIPKVPTRNENFSKGLVSFSQLESALSQPAENQISSLPFSIWSEDEIENCFRVIATDKTVPTTYLPTFFRSSNPMSSSDRTALTLLKRYVECHRLRFAELICTCRKNARRDLSSSFLDYNRSKFLKLNFSTALVNSFFDFFILNPDFLYNFRLSRRFLITSNQTRWMEYAKYESREQFSSNKIQLRRCLPPVASCIPKVTQTSFESDHIPVDVSQNESKEHSCSDMSSTFNQIRESREFEPKLSDEIHENQAKNRLSVHHSSSSNPKKLMQELATAFNVASEKCNRVDDDLILRAKKLLEDVIAMQANASEEQTEKIVEVTNLSNGPATITLHEESVISNESSTACLSKTPFGDDLDTADLMFICDLSEKTVLSEKATSSSDLNLSRKNSKIAESPGQHHRKTFKSVQKNLTSVESPCSMVAEAKVTSKVKATCDPVANSNLTTASMEYCANRRYSLTSVPKSTPLRSSVKKLGNLHGRNLLLDDIENWNPESPVSMSREGIKKELLPTRSAKNVGNSSVIMDGTSYLTNKFAFDGFNTATGRTINVHPNSLIRAKKLLDSIEVEPETAQKQSIVSDELKISHGRIPLVNNKNEKSVGNMRLSESSNDSKGPDDKMLLPFPASKSVNFDSSRDEVLKKLAQNSSERIAESKNAESCVEPPPSFSTASGKKMSVSEKSLEKAKKIYESTAEETADEIKLKGLGDDRSLRVSSCGPDKKAAEIGAQKLNENRTFKKPFVNPILSNVFEVESFPRSPQPAIGNKLTAKENSAGCAEKLRSLPSRETSELVPNLRFASFSSASGKEIAVTGTSLEKAKKILESTLEATSLCSSDENNIGVQNSVPLASLKTAEGEKFYFGEEPLRKTKKWFECISDNLIEEKIESVETNPKQLLPASDFATRKKTRAEEVSRESKNWSVPASEETLLIVRDQEFSKFPSFSTARGKKLMVTESSLRKAEKLYATTAEEAVKSEENRSGPFLNFKSESDKKQQASSAEASFASTAESSCTATHQSSAFSRSSDKENVMETASKSTNNVKQSASDDFLCPVDFAQFSGFSTASGKKVDVSERSLKNDEKLYDAVAQETGEKIEAPGQNSSASGRKLTVGEESLRSGQKLLDDCSDKVSNESAMGPGVQPQLSTFCSAAGKTINVAEKYLLNAEKLFQSVSDETLKEDFAPRNLKQGKVQFNSKPCDIAIAPSLRLKRSLNEDAIQNVASSNVGKKMKTDENAMKLSAKSDEIILEPGEENLEITPPKRGVGLRISCSIAKKQEENSTVSLPVQLNDASELLVDSPSMCSDENNWFRKISFESSLESTVLLNEDTGLRNAGTKEFSENPTSVSEICESNSTKKEVATDDSALLNLSQEISESTSAFLFDMNNDNLVFGNEQSPSYFDPADEQKTERASRSPSPVFDSNKPGRKKKYKKRRSQYSLSLNPLDVTYVRKDSENASVREASPEEVLKMLNKNFAQKVNKRKEPASNLVYPSSKKTKDSNKNEDIVEQRKQALLEQEKLVSRKDGQLCKPRVGSILTEKLHGNRKSLREMVNCERPQRYSVSKLLQLGLKRSVVNVSAENAHEFIFTADFLSPERTTYGDDCAIIPNEKNEVYFDDLARAFLASPGVDPRLISLPWIRNHYRWIIWKLASTERSFPHIFGGKYLTLNNVLLQLKFRYDWEVDRCRRSALKRILECDSSPSETIILCVATIKTIVASLNEYEIEMTDGWYSVPCAFDGEMLKLLTQKKVTVGTKLMIMNAELTGAGEGCDPLQLNQNVRFKIATNSVRRVRWYTPLGFFAGNPIVISNLGTILPNGGTVPQFSAVIARVYPVLYLDKKEDGSHGTLHNEKVHFKKMADFEKRRQICLESLLSQVTSEVENENPSMDTDDYRNTDSYSDQVARQNDQYREQERLKILIQERVQQRLPEEFKKPKRISSMLKVRLINKDARGDPFPTVILTIWHPPEDFVSLLSEGKLYEFHKVVANGIRNGQVQLSASRMTKYKHLSVCNLSYHGRRVTAFTEFSADFKAVFGEVDIVGLVINVKEIARDTKNDGSQTIFLTDLDKNLMAVKFRTNVKDLGFEDTLKLENVIAGLNLQWKRSLCNGQIPMVFASELTSFVYKSRCEHLQNCIDKFNNLFKSVNIHDFVADCNKKLNEILVGPSPVATSTPVRSNLRPPLANENSVTPKSWSSDGSLKQNYSGDGIDDNGNAKGKSIHSRIEKLRGYGEPPPLSPISMCSRPKSSRLSIQTRVHKLSINKN